MIFSNRFASGLALSLMLMTGAAQAGTAIGPGPSQISVSGDHGGRLISYALKTAKIRKSGRLVRVTGRCDSACTLYLSLPPRQLCVSPGATFRFHSPFGSSRKGNRAAANYMMRKYPGWVRSWIVSRGGLNSRLITMNYGYASRFLPKCKSASLQTAKPKVAQVL